MIRAIIVDDEPAARASLELEIRLHCPEIKVIAEASSVLEGIKVIQANPGFELLFLDIQMADGSGFDLLQNVDTDQFKTIFTTAYSEYALRAIKFTPLDYLLKPIDAEELKAAVSKALRHQQTGIQEQIRRYMSQLAGTQANPRVALATAEGIHLYFVKNIVRCASDGNYTTVFFEDKSKLLVAKTLKDLESLLSPHQFERIHKSHLINLEHLRRYYNRFSGEVEMSDGAVLPVAQRKKTYLLDLLNGLNTAELDD
jgi:two-component system LytT family response regulator